MSATGRRDVDAVLAGERQWTLCEGDCLAPDGLAALPDGCVDHVITDPPYEEEAHTEGRRIKTRGWGRDYGTTGPCVLDFAPITDAERQAAAVQMVRIARRWDLVFCQVEAVAAWRAVLVDAGASYRRTCAWLKPDAQPQMSGDRPGMGYESIVCVHAPGRSRWNGGGKRGVYEAVRAITADGHRKAYHMAEKPVDLMLALVRDFTDPGELICDPFASSGTTGVAALSMGRRFIGWEKDLKYAAIARKRLERTREQLSLLGDAT